MKKIVIKVGSSTLSGGGASLCKQAMDRLATQISALAAKDYAVILVSSGAILAGREVIQKSGKQVAASGSIPSKQMLAAIGQVYLMEIWQELFSNHNISIAQILLTKQDISHPLSLQNARNTFDALLHHQVLPIVNENDTTATDEIKVGDNDTLSAEVAVLCSADLLILLTDQDGLYTADPRKEKNASPVPVVERIDEQIRALGGSSSHPLGVGTGGMATKITAADLATKKGIATLITSINGPATLLEIVAGKKVGTYFKPAAPQTP